MASEGRRELAAAVSSCLPSAVAAIASFLSSPKNGHLGEDGGSSCCCSIECLCGRKRRGYRNRHTAVWCLIRFSQHSRKSVCINK